MQISDVGAYKVFRAYAKYAHAKSSWGRIAVFGILWVIMNKFEFIVSFFKMTDFMTKKFVLIGLLAAVRFYLYQVCTSQYNNRYFNCDISVFPLPQNVTL